MMVLVMVRSQPFFRMFCMTSQKAAAKETILFYDVILKCGSSWLLESSIESNLGMQLGALT